MLQDIWPKKLCNAYQERQPLPENPCFVCCKQGVLVRRDGDVLEMPRYREIAEQTKSARYLFCIDDASYFLIELLPECKGELPGFDFTGIRSLRQRHPQDLVFAAATAWHLYCWYRDNQYCGRCGGVTWHHQGERRLDCHSCGKAVYPTIAPAVIIAVSDGDRLLLSKYNGRAYTGYALLAGFTEIGETAEQTVEREVMEEVGLRVKNIRYYKSQPWGLDCNLLFGFYAELEGSDRIRLDENELSQAGWYRKGELEISDDVSLTNEMIRHFFATVE